MYDMSGWDDKLNFMAAVYRSLGATVEYSRGEMATAAEIADLEEKLGHPLPPSLIEFLTTFTKCFLFSVTPPENHFPDEIIPDFIYLEISLDTLARDENERLQWVRKCFTNPDDSYDRIWHDKIAVLFVPNGDFIALDLTDAEEDKRVVYLSHDGDDNHGYVLAPSFGEFIERFIDIGNLQTEIWELRMFFQEEVGGYLDPECENAKEYRRYIGLDR